MGKYLLLNLVVSGGVFVALFFGVPIWVSSQLLVGIPLGLFVVLLVFSFKAEAANATARAQSEVVAQATAVATGSAPLSEKYEKPDLTREQYIGICVVVGAICFTPYFFQPSWIPWWVNSIAAFVLYVAIGMHMTEKLEKEAKEREDAAVELELKKHAMALEYQYGAKRKEAIHGQQSPPL